MRQKQKPVDRIFLMLLLILVFFGLLMVFSASMYSSVVESGGTGFGQFLRQSVYVVIGLVIMAALSRVSYERFNHWKFARRFYVLTLLLLAAVPVVGRSVNGARRWIAIGPLTLQPSELAKMAGIIYIAVVLTKKEETRMHISKYILYCFIPTILLCALAAIEPSLSAALAIAAAMFFAMYFGKVPWQYFLIFVAFIGVAFVGLLIVSPWRMDRLNVFRGQGGQNYQIMQSLLAIGSGGLFGKGLGGGSQKLLYLPELQNDFIFANVGEEMGLIGCVVLLALFIGLIVRGFQIARSSKDEFGYIYTSSVIALIAFQVIVNIGVSSGIMPVTGMALPFVSAGGTSEIILLAMMGPILNISRHNPESEPKGKTKTKTRPKARQNVKPHRTASSRRQEQTHKHRTQSQQSRGNRRKTKK